jgi:DNA-binding FadR family transcriptional regulator
MTTAHQSVRVPKTAELVAAQLRRRIVRGELAENDPLPPESTLMQQFGVSRPTLREAFRVLESEALISVRRGARGGARVHTPNGDVAARYAALVLEHGGTTLRDIYTARAVIEPACAGMLAANRSEQTVTTLCTALADEEAQHAAAPSIRAHLAFHALVVREAGNQTLGVLAGMLRHIVDLANEEHVLAEADTAQTRKAFRDGHRAHRRLIDLIAAGDGPGARELWRRHLEGAEDYLLDGNRAQTVLDLIG